MEKLGLEITRQRIKTCNDVPYFIFWEQESLLSRLQCGASHGLVVLQNKAPWWSVQRGIYEFDFNGRVTRDSVKNFQIAHPDDRELLGVGLPGQRGMGGRELLFPSALERFSRQGRLHALQSLLGAVIYTALRGFPGLAERRTDFWES